MPSLSKRCAYVDFPDPEGPHMKITRLTDGSYGRPWTGPVSTLPGDHDELRRVSSRERSIPVAEHVGDDKADAFERHTQILLVAEREDVAGRRQLANVTLRVSVSSLTRGKPTAAI